MVREGMNTQHIPPLFWYIASGRLWYSTALAQLQHDFLREISLAVGSK